MSGFLVCSINSNNIPGMELNEVQLASKEQFGKQSSRYGKNHILNNVADVEAAAAYLQLPENAEVLDVATGAGHTGLFFAGRGCNVILSDIAEPMLEQARQLANERGLRVQTRVHSAEKFPDSDETFDLVCCRVAAHHFSSPESFVAETGRVLKPQGYFLLIDGTVEDGYPEAEEWSHQVEKLRDPSHHRFIPPRTWASFCEKAGLEIIHCGLTPFKMPDLNWYFETAATTPENREKVLQLVEQAPESARTLFKLGRENEKIVWWWQRLTLIAKKI